jgi:membrane-bound lytic murein transglycosylase A
VARARHSAIVLGVLFCALAGGAGLWWYLHPQPGPLTLHKAAFADLDGWTGANHQPALSAFQRSCQALAKKPDSEAMGSYGGTLADWRPACAAAAKTNSAQARAFFEHWFRPVSVTAGRVEQGRFTGYFEPEIKGSRSRHDAFQTAVYGKPDDLIQVDLGAFRPALAGERIAGRLDGSKLVPYAARAEIVARGLKNAKILFYTNDKIELFFLHIQGSGRVTFEDGSQSRVAYAAQNGQPYTAIGKSLIARGVPKNGMSLQVIRAWLNAHPGEADAVMNEDASYIFFSEEPVGDAALGAKGAQGVPLTPKASLAVDTRIHALGTPFYVAGPAPLDRLLIAQDIGGAIRGVIRGDVYFGYGKKAESEAGTMNQPGRFYALLPRPVAARLEKAGTLK